MRRSRFQQHIYGGQLEFAKHPFAADLKRNFEAAVQQCCQVCFACLISSFLCAKMFLYELSIGPACLCQHQRRTTHIARRIVSPPPERPRWRARRIFRWDQSHLFADMQQRMMHVVDAVGLVVLACQRNKDIMVDVASGVMMHRG